MATREEATGFADKKLIENCPLVITTIDCREDEAKKTCEFDYKIAGKPKDTDALFLKDIHESTKKEGFFGSTYEVYKGTKVESDDLGKVIDEVAAQRGASHCILYAHGLGSDPANTIKTAGDMNDYFSKGTKGERAFVVPICWPAEEDVSTWRNPLAIVSSYTGQKEDAEGAAKAMRSILPSLGKANTKMAIMCHSMGNFLLKRFAPEGPDDFTFCACFMVAADVRSVTFSECPEAYVPKKGAIVKSDKPPTDDKGNVIKDENLEKNWDHDGADICRVVDGKIHIVHHYWDFALLGRRAPMFGNTGKNDFAAGRRALGKVGPEFQYKPLDFNDDLHKKTPEEPYVSGYLTDESSLHESAKGKLVVTDGTYFHGEFGLFGSTGGHSYQDGERICNYYLVALGLPKVKLSDPKK